MINYAYQVQVRDTEDTEWMDHGMLVSPVGHAPQALLAVVYEGHENLVRVQRINHSIDFLVNLERGVDLAVYDAEPDLELQFVDRTLDIPREALE